MEVNCCKISKIVLGDCNSINQKVRRISKTPVAAFFPTQLVLVNIGY
jgi:hypothetical protein